MDGYEILRRRPQQGERQLQTFVADTGSSATSYTDTSATAAGQRYVYRVKAIRNGVRSERSNFARVDRPAATNTPVPPPPPTNTSVPPPPPTNTSVPPLATNTSISPPTNTQESSALQRSVVQQFIKPSPTPTLRFARSMHDTPTPTQTPSPTATATTDSSPRVGDTPRLTGWDRSIWVRWGEPTGGATRVKVFWRRQGSGSYQDSGLVAAEIRAAFNFRGYDILNLAGNTTYEVYVQAFNANGVGGTPSSVVIATTFNLEIANLRASGTADSFVVTWSRRSEHAYYHVYWRKERGGGSGGVGSLDDNRYTITGLDPGEPYIIEVAASNSDHLVGLFTTIVATPRTPAGAPPAPGAPQLAQDGDASADSDSKLIANGPMEAI